MSDQSQPAEEKPNVSGDESTPLQRLLRLVAREVVRQLKAEQTPLKEPPEEGKTQ
jgi:hypothetical protein